jgi:hypothetical protein
MSPLPRRGDRWKRKSTQETTSGITNPRSRHEAAQDLSMRKYEKYPLSPITGLIPQADESGNVPHDCLTLRVGHPRVSGGQTRVGNLTWIATSRSTALA